MVRAHQIHKRISTFYEFVTTSGGQRVGVEPAVAEDRRSEEPGEQGKRRHAPGS